MLDVAEAEKEGVEQLRRDLPWVKVGEVSTDGARLWIGDPNYGPYSRACDETDAFDALNRQWEAQPGNPAFFNSDSLGWPFHGLHFWTLDGDGTFPVYAQMDGNRPMRVMVDMGDEEWFDGDGE